MNYIDIISKELNLKEQQVRNTIKLLDEDATVPFIARYRKEVTKNLDEIEIRAIEKRTIYLRNLEERKKEVLKSIDEQGKLTEELEQKINLSMKLNEVEALYAPFKRKKKTKADIAIDNGLQSLCDFCKKTEIFYKDIENEALKYINEKIKDVFEAIQGAKFIMAQEISQSISYREKIRNLMKNKGIVKSNIIEKNRDIDRKKTFNLYYEYEERVNKIPNHRVLALNRGENEKIILVKINFEDEEFENIVKIKLNEFENKNLYEFYQEIIIDSLQRLILPSIEREIRNILTERSQEAAIIVFEKNLNNLLMQPPMKNKNILGLDPAFRTGCKVVVVDHLGDFKENTTMFIMSGSQQKEAEKIIKKLIEKYEINLIVIGNGTASRETEKFISDFLTSNNLEAKYIIVNEAGASVYSASQIANEEYPKLDLTVRGAISIAKRVQDPLSELVKINPESIGVGMYQHDMEKKSLSAALENVVESSVNNVGVDLNTSSWALLKYVSGMTKSNAQRVTKHRKNNGQFNNRQELFNVKGIGPKLFEQAAGFLTILNGDNPFDETIIHPESYKIAEKILQEVGYEKEDLREKWKEICAILKELNIEEFIQKYDLKRETTLDIYHALLKKRRDPRENYPQPVLRSDILKLEDLKEDMFLEGVVRNILDFGAFVDIGLKQDALLHISEMSHKRVKAVHEILELGDIIKVKVIKIEKDRGRVSLSMKY